MMMMMMMMTMLHFVTFDSLRHTNTLTYLLIILMSLQWSTVIGNLQLVTVRSISQTFS